MNKTKVNNKKATSKKESNSESAKVSNFDLVKNYIEKVTMKPLQSIIIPLELIQYSGNIQRATFLARMIYLSDKGIRKDGFIWKSYRDWKEEIGLSQDQIERIVDYFLDKKILIAKKFMARSKNQNASNTWHYKLLIGKFLAELGKFILVRDKKNSQLEARVTSTSITNDTDIKTPENVTLCEATHYPNPEEEIQNQNNSIEEITDYVNETDIDFDRYSNINLNSAAPIPNGIPLPEDFAPTLRSKIWAIEKFSKKSLKLVTDKFTNYFGERKNALRSRENWQTEWRNWVATEKQFNVDKYSLENEHLEIENELIRVIGDEFVNSANKEDKYLLAKDEIFEELCENEGFEKSVVEECWNFCITSKQFTKYLDWYYITDWYEEWGEEINAEIRKLCEKGDVFDEINDFIKAKLLFKTEDLVKFTHFSQDDVETFLKAFADYRFEKSGDYYFESIDYIDLKYQDDGYKDQLEIALLSLEEVNTAPEHQIKGQLQGNYQY